LCRFDCSYNGDEGNTKDNGYKPRFRTFGNDVGSWSSMWFWASKDYWAGFSPLFLSVMTYDLIRLSYNRYEIQVRVFASSRRFYKNAVILKYT
jgi:hypothetical protein